MKKNTNVKNTKKGQHQKKIVTKTKEKITSNFDLSIQNIKLQTINPNENLKFKTPIPNITTEIDFFQKNISNSGSLNH